MVEPLVVLDEGADVRFPEIEAPAVKADKAYDADETVRKPLAAKKCEVVIPSFGFRTVSYPYDKEHMTKSLIKPVI